MEFKWIVEKDKKLTFKDRVHNLACFEIVLNILRMKTQAGEDDVSDEIEALCSFALEASFKDEDLGDGKLFDRIIRLKDKTVNTFRSSILKQADIPEEMAGANEIGEA